jgi:hypothetical protein
MATILTLAGIFVGIGVFLSANCAVSQVPMLEGRGRAVTGFFPSLSCSLPCSSSWAMWR